MELVAEVKKHKREVKIWNYWAFKCYKHLNKVTTKLKDAREKNPKVVTSGINIQVQD